MPGHLIGAECACGFKTIPKSCFSNNSLSSRIVVCRVTVFTSRVMNCCAVHARKPYIVERGASFVCILGAPTENYRGIEAIDNTAGAELED